MSGPLDNKSGYITLIVEKRYSDKIRLTLDTQPMACAVKTAKFQILTPSELRNRLRGVVVRV